MTQCSQFCTFSFAACSSHPALGDLMLMVSAIAGLLPAAAAEGCSGSKAGVASSACFLGHPGSPHPSLLLAKQRGAVTVDNP